MINIGIEISYNNKINIREIEKKKKEKYYSFIKNKKLCKWNFLLECINKWKKIDAKMKKLFPICIYMYITIIIIMNAKKKRKILNFIQYSI